MARQRIRDQKVNKKKGKRGREREKNEREKARKVSAGESDMQRERKETKKIRTCLVVFVSSETSRSLTTPIFPCWGRHPPEHSSPATRLKRMKRRWLMKQQQRQQRQWRQREQQQRRENSGCLPALSKPKRDANSRCTFSRTIASKSLATSPAGNKAAASTSIFSHENKINNQINN